MKALILVALCSCAASAKIQYGAQLNACIDQASTKAEADLCIQRIQLEWSEAGSPPALVIADGGVQ
jgi:hypothetical protein